MRLVLSLLMFFSVYANSNHGNGYIIENDSLNKKAYMIDFSKQEKGLWRVTDDGVMGGLSNGNMIFEQDHGIFNGNISLDNNGGFSSVFRVVENLPEHAKNLVIDVKGDGQSYQLRLVIYINGYRLAYKHDFKTTANKREKITLSIADFKATFRGRMIQSAPILNSVAIKEVGFLMTKKAAGQFSLSVFELYFLKE
jgi:hypothetical protein